MNIFENLQGGNNGNEFLTALAERTLKYYGTASKFFVDEVRFFEIQQKNKKNSQIKKQIKC